MPPFATLRARLERQRAFRLEQIAELNARSWAGNGAVDEVLSKVASAARHALTDIENALSRVDTERYGRCQDCQSDIPIGLLEAIPQSTRCLTCQRPYDET